MRKRIAITFAIIYLLATTQVSEVLKLPLFVGHFMDFQGGLVEYVVHHYGGHEMDEDWDVDMKLPFMELSTTLTFAFSLPESVQMIAPIWIPISTDVICHWQEQAYPNADLDNLFQPPRNV